MRMFFFVVFKRVPDVAEIIKCGKNRKAGVVDKGRQNSAYCGQNVLVTITDVDSAFSSVPVKAYKITEKSELK